MQHKRRIIECKCPFLSGAGKADLFALLEKLNVEVVFHV